MHNDREIGGRTEDMDVVAALRAGFSDAAVADIFDIPLIRVKRIAQKYRKEIGKRRPREANKFGLRNLLSD
jgi:DNA-directed RNA polymerase specialized sigma24 family protein